LARCDDGSQLSRIGELTVRVITADITVTCADGTRYVANYRLATTLTDPRRHPAGALIGLYHERWEHEIAYLALRHTLGQGRVLRSTDPAGLKQEMWALLTTYQALRRAMVTAVESRPGTDPDRASFAAALHTARDLITQAANIIDDEPTPSEPSAVPSSTTCTRPHGPAPACERSNHRSRGTTRKTRTQHPDHRPERHHQRTGNERLDTRTEVLDNSPRTLTTRHCP
jgi:hypothetical protein